MFFSRRCGSKHIDRGLVTVYDLGVGDFVYDNQWHELDLSAIVGKGVKLLRISLGHQNSSGLIRGMYLRTNGQTDTKNFSSIQCFPNGQYNEYEFTVQTDIDGKVEYKAQSATYTVVQFLIRGWFI